MIQTRRGFVATAIGAVAAALTAPLKLFGSKDKGIPDPATLSKNTVSIDRSEMFAVITHPEMGALRFGANAGCFIVQQQKVSRLNGTEPLTLGLGVIGIGSWWTAAEVVTRIEMHKVKLVDTKPTNPLHRMPNLTFWQYMDFCWRAEKGELFDVDFFVDDDCWPTASYRQMKMTYDYRLPHALRMRSQDTEPDDSHSEEIAKMKANWQENQTCAHAVYFG